VLSIFQRILGLKIPENLKDFYDSCRKEAYSIYFTYEHHSNQTSWLETIADVVVIPSTEDGLFSIENLLALLEEYEHRPLK
jgi:selenocysteine lyase/cysteine desulfurase